MVISAVIEEYTVKCRNITYRLILSEGVICLDINGVSKKQSFLE